MNDAEHKLVTIVRGISKLRCIVSVNTCCSSADERARQILDTESKFCASGKTRGNWENGKTLTFSRLTELTLPGVAMTANTTCSSSSISDCMPESGGIFTLSTALIGDSLPVAGPVSDTSSIYFDLQTMSNYSRTVSLSSSRRGLGFTSQKVATQKATSCCRYREKQT